MDLSHRSSPLPTLLAAWGLTFILVLMVMLGGCQHRPYHAVRADAEGPWVPVPAVETQISDERGARRARDYCTVAPEAQSKSKATAAIERTSYEGALLYTLGFVDVDDQGNFWSEAQVGYVVDQLTRTRAAGEVDAPTLFIVYVPGWTHSSWACDSHVRNFRRSLEMVAKRERAEAALAHRAPREVKGLYFGWQGHGDFLGRKAAADRAGRSAGVALLARLGPYLQTLRDDPHSASLLVGQSLGAAVLNETVAAHFLTELAEVRGGADKAIVGPASLVVYLNPAFEASRFVPIHTMWEDAIAAGQIRSEQTTQLIVYQTEGDRAVEDLFPTVVPLSRTGTPPRGGASGPAGGPLATQVARSAADPNAQFGCVHLDPDEAGPRNAGTPTAFYSRLTGSMPGAQPRLGADTAKQVVRCGWVDGLPTPGDGRLFRFAYDAGELRAAYGHSDVFNAALIGWIWDVAASVGGSTAPEGLPKPGGESQLVEVEGAPS